MKKPEYAIVGAGNGGQSMAAHLTLMGFKVSLYDVEPEKISALKERGSIKVSGEVTGEAVVDLVTGDIGEAIRGKDIIMVVLPTVYQGSIARSMAPFLTDNQCIVLNPGGTGGALEVRNAIRESGQAKHVIVAETDTLIYACRSPRAGEAVIAGIKGAVRVAALPASDTPKVLSLLNPAFPQYQAAPSVLHTSLGNVNAMMHPAPTILNAARIESQTPFDYYTDGITARVTKIVEALDAERLAIAKAFGVEVMSTQECYMFFYGADGPTLYDKVRQVKAYEGMKGPTTLNTRYLFEDLPTGLVPLSCLGKALGVPTPVMDSVVELGNILLGKNFWKEGRSLERLGLAGKTPAEIAAMIA